MHAWFHTHTRTHQYSTLCVWATGHQPLAVRLLLPPQWRPAVSLGPIKAPGEHRETALGLYAHSARVLIRVWGGFSSSFICEAAAVFICSCRITCSCSLWFKPWGRWSVIPSCSISIIIGPVSTESSSLLRCTDGHPLTNYRAVCYKATDV